LSVVLGKNLPAAEDPITIDRIEFTDSCAPAGLMRRDQSRTRAAEKIKHDASAARNVFDGVGGHRNRLDRRMEAKLFKPAAILPDVRPVAAVLAEFEAVEMGGGPILEGEDQLMAGAIEGARTPA
jgi:hypothetical protein